MVFWIFGSFGYATASIIIFYTLTFSGLITYLQQLHDIYLPRDKLMACSLGNITMLTSSMCSVYLIITMTFERLYSIIIPHKAASFNTVKRAKITIGVIVVFSMLYNIPHLFITVFDGQRCIPYAKPIRKFDNQLYYWFSFVLMFALPFVLLLAMNSVIIHTLRKRSSSPMSKNETEADVVKTKNVEKQIFVILLLVTFGFLILTTPGYMMVLYVLIVDFSKTPRSFATYHLLYHIGQKTYFTNSAINFFLYVISGQKFRTDLVNLFRSSKP